MQKTRKRGFTLIETFIAVSILMLAVVGPLTIAQKGIRAGAIAKEQTVAAFLAQDALEFLRAYRDGSPTWNDLFTRLSACMNNQPCYFGNTSSADDAITACPGFGNCPQMRVNTNGQYGYVSTWSATPFIRQVTVKELAPRREMLVRVSIYHAKLSPSVPISEIDYYLTDW